MEAALGSASWLLGLVLNKLSEDLVNGYMSSAELGVNLVKIRKEMLYTKGLLEAAQGRDLAGNSGLKGLLEDLSKKADEAEDALDELHYFMIQDKLDGTREATPELGDGLSGKAQHARHAARHTSGNWLSCFSCCRSQDDVAAAKSLDHGGYVEKLTFDRVEISNKIKQLMEEMHSYCTPVSNLLDKIPSSNLQPHMPASTKRSDTSSEITQKKLFGRDAIFEKTINEIISVTNSEKILSVFPIVGPGGIGKTTFTQHLYNHTRFKEHFIVRAWICVSTNFDVLKITKEILSCLPATENAGNKTANETTNLDQLQKSIAERLKSKRFLLVLDDIWECSSSDEWEKLLAPFKKDETSGNVILVTTRFPKIVEMVTKGTNPIDLRGLDSDEFWKFFQICAFGRIQDEHGDQELIGIAKQIADKLKCSPLAAKTVGRLLIKKPFQEQWMKILENKEWLEEKHENDIIPALQISYDYLPFHMKKCFSCFALFPEDYKFDKFEIVRFWASVGIIDSRKPNEKIEDVGSDYLDELLDYLDEKIEGAVPRCVVFDLNGAPQFRDLEGTNVCTTYRQGHISIVVNSSGIAPAPAPPPPPAGAIAPPIPAEGGGKKGSSDAWKIAVGVVGGAAALGLLAALLLCFMRYKRDKKLQLMERNAEVGETLQMAQVGRTQAPVASGTRTQPVIENDYAA